MQPPGPTNPPTPESTPPSDAPRDPSAGPPPSTHADREPDADQTLELAEDVDADASTDPVAADGDAAPTDLATLVQRRRAARGPTRRERFEQQYRLAMRIIGAAVLLLATAMFIYTLLWLFPPSIRTSDSIVLDAPRRSALASSQPIHLRGAELQPLRRYEAAAMVLGRDRHRQAPDTAGELAPIDLAIGWGVLSDPGVYPLIHCRVHSRRMEIEPDDDLVFSSRRLLAHAELLHVIPAAPDVERALARAVEGQIVRVAGREVVARLANGATWRGAERARLMGTPAKRLLLVDRLEVMTPTAFQASQGRQAESSAAPDPSGSSPDAPPTHEASEQSPAPAED